MSGGQVLAHVRRVLTGHSDRALVHAVADAGLEIKMEVSAESVRDVSPDRGYVLMVSWSLLELPRAAEPAAASTAPAEPAAAAPGGPLTPANAVDAEFMALMARGRRTTPEPPPAAAATPSALTPANAVDAEFIALMTRARRPAPEPTSPTATSGPGPEQQIAALLGLVPGRPT